VKTSDLAKAVGLSVQQIRNYEALGFLPPAQRSANQYRQYTSHHLAALQTARQLIQGYGWQHALTIMQAIHRNDLDMALGLVDARHAELDLTRQQVDQTLAALRLATAEPVVWLRVRNTDGIGIRDAAKRVGVRVSALRYWEQRGLLRPARDAQNHYRRYNEHQLHCLQIIALLRRAGYTFARIRMVLDELDAGKIELVVEVITQRRAEVCAMSRACVEATVAFWSYATTWGTTSSSNLLVNVHISSTIAPS
jgi:DNA-binding transcriptional MerR regulator